MALKAKINKELFDKLDKLVQAEYKISSTDNTVYLLDVEAVDGFQLENASNLRSALESERQIKKNLEATVAAFKDLDPQVARQAITDLETYKNKNTTEKEKVDLAVKNVERQLTENFTKEKNALEAKNKNLYANLEESLIDSRVTQILQKHKGVPGLLLPVIRTQVRMEADQTNGKFGVSIVNKDGSIRITKKADRGAVPMDLEELVEDMKSDATFSRAFEGTQQSGSGSSGSTGGGSAGGKFVMKNSEAKNFQAYEAMRKEAQKVGQQVILVED